jgi:hypothetical protein
VRWTMEVMMRSELEVMEDARGGDGDQVITTYSIDLISTSCCRTQGRRQLLKWRVDKTIK